MVADLFLVSNAEVEAYRLEYFPDLPFDHVRAFFYARWAAGRSVNGRTLLDGFILSLMVSDDGYTTVYQWYHRFVMRSYNIQIAYRYY